ncbi:Ca2+-transporting ATPase [Mycoplasma testudineum]|uniref:Ca2+-transporting ATPase n=1 Tax=Mycoplasma testudineum TaxID=244584 RepID=A0A4R6IC20_9MOLU|nr:cation-translocating P-type ATPase [Mycoplasma testudineum]OYD26654.1 hypothetical protein CG473_02530 [Mycoplasma testudineum]TDO19783.1 Ca2+-transporting ATPase [Mycoplasma testudineum]
MTNLPGLNDSEIIQNREKYGKNILPSKKDKSIFLIFILSLFDLMTIMLFVAAFISLGLTIYKSTLATTSAIETTIGYFESFIILFVILVNGAISTFQTVKADKAVKSLNKLNESSIRVVRNLKQIIIPSHELVVGDIIIFESGDKIPADAKIINSAHLKINESILTGESLPVEKNASDKDYSNLALAERKNIIFSGTSVINGSGVAQVINVGVNSEVGKIAQLVNNEKKIKTPLEIKLEKLGKIFFWTGIVLFIAYFIASIVLLDVKNIANTWSIALIGGVSLAVAAIPEGLVTFTTIIMTLGMKNMANEKAIIKNLQTVETLGNVSILCSDKTGTLTQNKMTIVNWFTLKEGFKKSNSIDLKNELFTLSSLCTDANVSFDDIKNVLIKIGDPTETSILEFALENKIDKNELLKKYPRISHLPFDSDRKLMSVVNKIGMKNILITKGAPDVILNRINGLTKEQINLIEKSINEFSSKAYRTLAVAKKVLPLDKKITHEDEHDLEFVGLIAMVDPPREEAKQAILENIAAGIKTIMITGDHVNTAIAIAKELKIFNEGDSAITGTELEKLTDEELSKNIEKYTVYARVSPSNKIRIVKAWQKHDHVVSMTGDGVNDAPALKAADVGTAMGITGTEVSKDAADMIVVDDNFATIVKAIENGRQIYLKIKRVIQNLITTSLIELVVAFIGMIVFSLVYKNYFASTEFIIFSASQLLWINLLTHGFPAVALGLQKSKNNVMNQKPYSKYESIFARRMGIDLIWQGIFISILALLGYALGIEYIKNMSDIQIAELLISNESTSKGELMNLYGSFVGFAIVGFAAVFNSINLISESSIFKVNLKDSWIVLSSVMFSFIMILIALLIGPLSRLFHMPGDLANGNHWYLWIISIGFGLAIFPVMEIYKLFFNKKNNPIELGLTHLKIAEK